MCQRPCLWHCTSHAKWTCADSWRCNHIKDRNLRRFLQMQTISAPEAGNNPCPAAQSLELQQSVLREWHSPNRAA